MKIIELYCTLISDILAAAFQLKINTLYFLHFLFSFKFCSLFFALLP